MHHGAFFACRYVRSCMSTNMHVQLCTTKWARLRVHSCSSSRHVFLSSCVRLAPDQLHSPVAVVTIAVQPEAWRESAESRFTRCYECKGSTQPRVIQVRSLTRPRPPKAKADIQRYKWFVWFFLFRLIIHWNSDVQMRLRNSFFDSSENVLHNVTSIEHFSTKSNSS